ncbi:hypothetical protein Ciccas_011917 [Cichlidogyrus casuarinus]|uniref:Uncharacterized protein n=1 Tax=Cichlidogyrus casuarinus TaxID=1844966 RepID=A0ABD2PQK1_9PLAT
MEENSTGHSYLSFETRLNHTKPFLYIFCFVFVECLLLLYSANCKRVARVITQPLMTLLLGVLIDYSYNKLTGGSLKMLETRRYQTYYLIYISVAFSVFETAIVLASKMDIFSATIVLFCFAMLDFVSHMLIISATICLLKPLIFSSYKQVTVTHCVHLTGILSTIDVAFIIFLMGHIHLGVETKFFFAGESLILNSLSETFISSLQLVPTNSLVVHLVLSFFLMAGRVILGCLFGFVTGCATAFCTKFTCHHEVLETLLILVNGYISYFLGYSLMISDVAALTIYVLMQYHVTQHNVSKRSWAAVLAVCSILANLGEEFLFFMLGVDFAHALRHTHYNEIIFRYQIGSYFCILLVMQLTKLGSKLIVWLSINKVLISPPKISLSLIFFISLVSFVGPLTHFYSMSTIEYGDIFSSHIKHDAAQLILFITVFSIMVLTTFSYVIASLLKLSRRHTEYSVFQSLNQKVMEQAVNCALVIGVGPKHGLLHDLLVRIDL